MCRAHIANTLILSVSSGGGYFRQGSHTYQWEIHHGNSLCLWNAGLALGALILFFLLLATDVDATDLEDDTLFSGVSGGDVSLSLTYCFGTTSTIGLPLIGLL